MGPTELWSMIPKMVRRASRKRREPGAARRQRKYPAWHLVQIFLRCVSLGWSPGQLYEQLERQAGLRRQLRLPNRLISYSQFKKRIKTREFLTALLDVLRTSAAGALRAAGPSEVRVVAMDLTRLESDPWRDSRGAWGWDSRGKFFGYKLGLIISEHGVILGATLMRANWTEFHASGRLLRLARDTIQTAWGTVPVEHVVSDAGFDGEPVYRKAHRTLHAPMLCPPRRTRNPKARTARRVLWTAKNYSPHRFRDQQLWQDPTARDIFDKRTEVERVNGQLKDRHIRIDEMPRGRRGVRRLFPVCLAKLILYNLALNVNLTQGLPTRRIRHLVA